jgi:hypothetical protein
MDERERAVRLTRPAVFALMRAGLRRLGEGLMLRLLAASVVVVSATAASAGDTRGE